MITDAPAFIGFGILVVGTLTQIRKTYRQKQVQDISGWDVMARTLASILNLITILTTDNWTLRIGQSCLMVSLVAYWFQFGWYRIKPERKEKGR